MADELDTGVSELEDEGGGVDDDDSGVGGGVDELGGAVERELDEGEGVELGSTTTDDDDDDEVGGSDELLPPPVSVSVLLSARPAIRRAWCRLWVFGWAFIPGAAACASTRGRTTRAAVMRMVSAVWVESGLRSKGRSREREEGNKKQGGIEIRGESLERVT